MMISFAAYGSGAKKIEMKTELFETEKTYYR